MYCQSEGAAEDETISCSNVEECYYYCNGKKCNDKGIINATNAKNLYVIVQGNGEECLNGANILLPNNGNAYFSTQGAPTQVFKGLSLTEGTNTGQVDIAIGSASNNTVDSLQNMDLYVPNAESLKIHIIGQGIIKASTITCTDYAPPSTYHGSLEAPCVLDLGNNGYFDDDGKNEDTEIIVPNGVPKGLVFPSGYKSTG